MNTLPNSNEVGKWQQLIAKNPVAFTATIFFLMFGITYFINIRKNNDAEQYWKELYLKERAEKDKLKDELLVKAGLLNEYREVAKKADSTIVRSQELVNEIKK